MACSTLGKVETIQCPQPAPSLLIPAEALSKRGQAPITDQGQFLAQTAEDIGKYNELRERHNDLAGWVMRHCLTNEGE